MTRSELQQFANLMNRLRADRPERWYTTPKLNYDNDRLSEIKGVYEVGCRFPLDPDKEAEFYTEQEITTKLSQLIFELRGWLNEAEEVFVCTTN